MYRKEEYSMKEYDKVVRVETLTEYRTVLETWFKKGYDWYNTSEGKHNLHEERFTGGVVRYLTLRVDLIGYSFGLAVDTTKAMSFKVFMAEQKEDNKMETYYVTQGQLEFINTIYEAGFALDELLDNHIESKNMFDEFSISKGNAVLRYLGGDDSVVFKVKEPWYLLKGKNNDGDTVYFTFSFSEAPTYTFDETNAFKAPYDEIVRWKNSFWKIEQVDA